MTSLAKDALDFCLSSLAVWFCFGFIMVEWNVFQWEAYLRAFLIAGSVIGWIAILAIKANRSSI